MRKKTVILANYDESLNALLRWYAKKEKEQYKVCPRCKMPFVTSSWHGDLCIFCAKVKQFKNYRMITYPVRQCDECGRTYQPYSPLSKFCSAVCSNKKWFKTKKKAVGTCVVCGRTFKKRTNMQKCCSTSCSNKAKARTKPYERGMNL